MEVIDNFLSDYQFQSISKIFLSNQFPWYWSDCENIIQFTHIFYAAEENNFGGSTFSIVKPLVSQLGIKILQHIKANLNTRTFFPRKSGYHIDYSNLTSAIFYVTTNNGFTKFKNGRRIKSVANRMLIFDSNMVHTAVSSTNHNQRIVVNFNYG